MDLNQSKKKMESSKPCIKSHISNEKVTTEEWKSIFKPSKRLAGGSFSRSKNDECTVSKDVIAVKKGRVPSAHKTASL